MTKSQKDILCLFFHLQRVRTATIKPICIDLVQEVKKKILKSPKPQEAWVKEAAKLKGVICDRNSMNVTLTYKG